MRRMKNQLMEEQDQHLGEIIGIAQCLKKQSESIGKQINTQQKHIEDLNKQMDKTTSKMSYVQGKLSKLLKTNDMGQICTIVILFVIILVMILLVIYT